MSGLSDYLNALNSQGWSTRRIEREAEKHGHKISYASVARYLNGTHPATPSGEVLDAFAAVFAVDVNELRKRAGQPGVGEPFDLGPEAARLSGPQREAIRHLVRVMLDESVAREPVPHGATSRLSVVPGSLSRTDREELYRRAEGVDLDAEPYAAARAEDASDDDESV